jgi:DNA-binding protein H-NS
MPYGTRPFVPAGTRAKIGGIWAGIEPKDGDEAYALQLANELVLTAPVIAELDSLLIEHLTYSKARPTEGDSQFIRIGATLPRGKWANKKPLLTPDFKFNDVTSDVLTIIKQSTVWERFAHSIEEVTTIESILVNTGPRWPTYALLYDAVFKTKEMQKEQGQALGTIKAAFLDELTILGLGYAIPETYLLTNEEWERREGKRGRPYKVVQATKWGQKLVELLHRDGISPTDEMRAAARRRVKRSKPLSAVDKLLQNYQKPPTPETVTSGRGYVYEIPKPLGPPETSENEPLHSPIEFKLPTEEQLDVYRKQQEEAFKKYRQMLSQQETQPNDNLIQPNDNLSWLDDDNEEPFVVDHRNLPENWDKEA